MRLPDTVALITGAASGIGRSTAAVFAREGARLVLVDLNEAGARTVQEELEAVGAKAVVAPADVSDSAQVQAAVAAAVDAFGRIDALVNVAGMTHRLDTKLADVPDDVFDQTIAVNLRSVFLTCKHVIPQMLEGGGGAIVNVASTAALLGLGGAAYTASKGGVAALSRHVAYQYARQGIRCNTILPGVVETPMLEVFKDKEGLVPAPTNPGTLGRIGRPEEVGYLAAFLASGEAAFITGATYTLDGGVTLH